LVDEAALEETASLACPGCGADILWSGPVVTMECPFCATPCIAEAGPHRHIKPHGVIPFAIDSATAERCVKDWVQSRLFIPRALRRKRQMPMELHGMYLPYWVFYTSIIATYEGVPGSSHGTGSPLSLGRTRGSFSLYFDEKRIAGHQLFGPVADRRIGPWRLEEVKSFLSDGLSVRFQDPRL
jgi:hypothetical protein